LQNGFTIEENCKSGRDFYAVRCSKWLNKFGYAYAAPGNGVATFQPTIGVAGNYEVFEWHGRIDNVPMATNSKYVIKHARGTVNTTVNQAQNHRRWNSLGTYYFHKGTDGHVQIRSENADGYVMADAVKFVFRSLSGNRDITPPEPPRDVTVRNKTN
jgi:hypothetical protein